MVVSVDEIPSVGGGNEISIGSAVRVVLYWLLEWQSARSVMGLVKQLIGSNLCQECPISLLVQRVPRCIPVYALTTVLGWQWLCCNFHFDLCCS